MSGQKLVVGVIVMGLFVPAIVGYFLELHTIARYFTVAVTSVLGWAIADLTGTILARPRLRNRSPRDAIRDWERSDPPTSSEPPA